jgi:hypothetical protein
MGEMLPFHKASALSWLATQQCFGRPSLRVPSRKFIRSYLLYGSNDLGHAMKYFTMDGIRPCCEYGLAARTIYIVRSLVGTSQPDSHSSNGHNFVLTYGQCLQRCSIVHLAFHCHYTRHRMGRRSRWFMLLSSNSSHSSETSIMTRSTSPLYSSTSQNSRQPATAGWF